MKQIKFLTFAALIIGLFAVMPRAVHAQELRQEIHVDLGQFLRASLENDGDVSFADLFAAFSERYEELRGVELPPPSRYFEYPNRATISHDTYALHVYPFRLPGGPPHLFLHLRVWREDIAVPGGFSILAWDEEDLVLRPLRVHQEIPFDEFVEIEVVQLDESTAGIAVGGHSGATGDAGNFTVLAYDPEKGYETVWIIDAPGHRFTVIHEGMPLALSHLERAVWDASFPVDSLQGLSMAEIDAYRRQYAATYTWSRELRTFVRTERSEVMHDFAVVNHFLKAFLAGDESALQFVADASELYSLLIQPLPEDQPSIFRLKGQKARLVPLSPHTSGLARMLGIDVDSGRWIALAAMPEEAPLEPGGDITDAAHHALALAFFELQPGDPARIARALYYEPEPLPDELVPDLVYDARPTLHFDKLAIRAWAFEHGWSEANARVRRAKHVDGVSDWLRVSAVLSTPLVRWVEYHYRSDLHLEPPSRAEELYESTVGLDVTPFLLQITSANIAALEPENIRVVLADDRGNRWQGTITPGHYDAYSLFGVGIYERLFWLEFSGPQTEEEWAEINELTLYVIRQDRLARADLTWRFSP